MDTIIREYIKILAPSELDQLIAEMQTYRANMKVKKEEIYPNNPQGQRKFFQAKVTEHLLKLGISQNVKGYEYIKVALLALAMEPELIWGIREKLYSQMAKHYNTTLNSVSSSIRHAIAVAWKKQVANNLEVVQEYFGKCITPESKTPADGVFMATISNYMREEWMTYLLILEHRQKKVTDKKIESFLLWKKITECLAELHIPQNLRGYDYLRFAIANYVEREELRASVYYCLYPAIAEHFNTSVGGVERTMRNIITRAWDNQMYDGVSYASKYFGNSILGKNESPTVSQFITTLSKYLLKEPNSSQ